MYLWRWLKKIFNRKAMNNQKPLTAEQKARMEKISRIRANAARYGEALQEDIRRNNQTQGGGVYDYHGTWVVKPHSNVPVEPPRK